MELSGSESPESTTPNIYYRKDNVSIHVIKQDAYNVLSVLRSYVSNISGYSATSNLVPILGADSTLLKTNEQKLIKKFKKLSSTVVEDDVCYLKLEHLQPFFDVFKTFDSRHVKLLIMCVEVLSNLAKNDLLHFEKNEAKELMNKLFSEVLAVFSSVIDLKEDIFDCFHHMFRSYYGNLVSNENTCNMLKLCVSLLSIRNRNSFFKKVFYTKVTDVLLSTLGNREKYGGHDKELYRRVNSVFLLLSLLSGLSNRMNHLGYYTEDSYLSVYDKDTMLSFRSHLSPVLNSLFNVPSSFNEFSDDVRKMSLILFNTTIECNLVDLSNLNLVPILQAHFAHSMYKLLFTDSITLYSLVLRSFWNMYLHFRLHLKAQVELFFNYLISSVTNYANTSKRTRLDMLEMNMEFLSEMSKNSDFLLEMFLNFDCDVKCSNLFSEFVNCLLTCISVNSEAEAGASKLEQSKTKKTLPKSAVKKTNPQYKSNTNASENGSQINLDRFALDTLQNIVKFLLTDYTLYTNDIDNYEENIETGKENVKRYTWKMNKLVEKKYKDRIAKCSILFNEGKGDEWMNEVRKLGVFSKYFTEKEVALFLKYAPNLDMKKVGEYLATHKNPEFMDKVRSYFVQLNHFAGMPVVMAIRVFLSSFMIPGESQQIERLLEIFSKVYFASQPLVDPKQLNVNYMEDNTGKETKEDEEELPEELKMARWVVQEDFYHKHKTLQQWKFLPSYLNSLGLSSYDSIDLSYMENKETDSPSRYSVESTPRSENFDLSREPKGWEANMNMYKYYLSNDLEGYICKQNYRKICEYLKKTPVTLETQSTYNDFNSSNSNKGGENNSNPNSTNNTGRNADTERSLQSTDNMDNSSSRDNVGSNNNKDNKENIDKNNEDKNNNHSNNTKGTTNTNKSNTNNSVPSTPKRRVTVEYKPGFAYVQHYDAIFVLCYSIIMLNTDQHNQQIKNRMKIDDFVRNNRSTNHGKNFSSEFLHDIYRTIKYHEIKLHSGNMLNSTNYYDPFLWSDYVLQRQKQLSPYTLLTRLSDEEMDPELKGQRAAAKLVQKTLKDKKNNKVDKKHKEKTGKETQKTERKKELQEDYDSDDLKMQLFGVLLKNNLLNVLDQMFLWCRNVDILKEIVQFFWLLVRVGLKYSDHELINRMFQLPSLDVSYALGYRCQISISFILNVFAVSSEFFDRKSWAKSLDIVTRFYCLNLLPPTFAALDGDQRIFSSQPTDLLVPSIRFKRLTDKKSNSWLVGLSYFVPFGKGTSNPEVLKNMNKEAGEGECDETFLFLFDVQLNTNDLVENKFFDVYLLRNKFSPVYSIEDEFTINNVTNKLSNEEERQELLPPILTYINLRLAFLNIYKLDDLFMGVVISGNLDSFQLFLSVMLDNIFEVSSSDEDNLQSGTTSVNSSSRDSSREKDNFGNILDPSYVELDRFRDKITSIFNLGIFSRLVLQMLVTPNRQQEEQGVKSNRFNKNNSRDNKKKDKEKEAKKVREKYKIYVDDECDSEEKKIMLLTCFVETFYNLSRSLVFKESLKHLPPTEDLYKFFDLKPLDSEYFFHFKEENLKEELDDSLSNYFAFILLNLVFWLVDYYNNNKDVETPTNTMDVNKSNTGNLQAGTTSGGGSKTGHKQDGLVDTGSKGRLGAEFRADYGLVNLSSWLLHLFINFDNKLFNHYLEPLEKLLYNLAHSSCISHNNYLVVVMLCAIQRMVNPYLPFGSEPFKKGLSKTNTSILTVLLRRSKCLSWNNPYVAKLTAQTLLSIALYSNTNGHLSGNTNNVGNTSTKGSSSKEKADKEDKNNTNKDGSDKENQYTENQLAIQLMIEFNSFAKDDSQDNLEHLWLLSLHSLSVVFAIGPSAVANEAMKGMNKLLLQQPYPKSNCTFTSQVARIFDYVLSPMLTLNFYYPLPNNIQTPLNKKTNPNVNNVNNYNLCNPFQNKADCSDANHLWMSGFMNEYLNNFAFKDFDDLATRKASATNLICHAVLSKLTALISEQKEQVPDDLLKSSASNLECLLCDNKDFCEENCVKRLVVLTQYVLNVIIPSNGEIHTGISRDTYLETLKNFILVLLTSPELKIAPESCLSHFKNDSELKVCLEVLKDEVSFDKVTSGEYVLSSLLAHTFSSSDSLKNLFLEVLRVVFPKPEEEPTPPETSEEEENEETDEQSEVQDDNENNEVPEPSDPSTS